MADQTDQICNQLLQPFETIPSKARELSTLIKADLLCKLPVAGGEEVKFPILKDFIYTSEEVRRSTIAMHINYVLSDPIGDAVIGTGSEDMMHSSVDALIRYLLQIFVKALGGKLPIEFDRNRADPKSTTKGRDRPDFLCWTREVLLFKGEENGDAKDFDLAVEELQSKFNICFYAIDGSPDAGNQLDRLIPLTDLLKIDHRRDRVTILHTMINITRIMLTVSTKIPNNIIPLGKRRKTGETTITFFDDFVEKKIPRNHLPYANDDTRIHFLVRMYKCAKGYPGLVQIKNEPTLKNRGSYKVLMTTWGLNILPKNEGELKAMSKSIITGLDRLHRGNFVHRNMFLSISNTEVIMEKIWLNAVDNMLMSVEGNDFVTKLKAKKLNASKALQRAWIKGL
ncbi:9959_t:CDS:2 [Ambispora gerdemannii]|uniref:9959_t:CDS:1 n=1 Tax=Ambispora gerdemannii TaxID=144530 RepID=A0A9N9CSY6_9GLOM|nr:9959_t:CDS:2 [Ambispora gerdemannii]